MLVVIGEILFDIFPEYRRLGGAPFNLACHMHHFGWPVKFLTRVGRDKDGEEIMHILKDAGFDLNDVQIDERKPTGRVMVELDSSGIPGFEIIQDSAYDYMEYTREMNDLPSDKIELIYFGTLMQRSERARKTIQGIISSRNPNTRCLYDVNLRPGCYTASIIEASLEQANIVKLNDHELSEIRDMPGNNPSGSGFIPWLMQKYNIEMLCVTKGDQGSELFTPEGKFTTPGVRVDNIVDTVGAGDAFTAVLAAGYLRKWPAQDILSKASQFAARICMIPGAIPADNNFYKDAEYMPKGETYAE